MIPVGKGVEEGVGWSLSSPGSVAGPDLEDNRRFDPIAQAGRPGLSCPKCDLRLAVDPSELSSVLEAVRNFLDAVDGVFPDASADNGPRRRIVDSAFKMTGQLVGAANELAQRIVKVTENALEVSEAKARVTKK
jgi:hypothetical protein